MELNLHSFNRGYRTIINNEKILRKQVVKPNMSSDTMDISMKNNNVSKVFANNGIKKTSEIRKSLKIIDTAHRNRLYE